MAFNLGFQTKYILNPWCILFHSMKVLLKVFSILSKVHSVNCGKKYPTHMQITWTSWIVMIWAPFWLERLFSLVSIRIIRLILTWKITRAPSQKNPSITCTAVWYDNTVKKIVKNHDNVWKKVLIWRWKWMGHYSHQRSFKNYVDEIFLTSYLPTL